MISARKAPTPTKTAAESQAVVFLNDTKSGAKITNPEQNKPTTP